MSRKTEIRKDVEGMNVGGWRVMGVGNAASTLATNCVQRYLIRDQPVRQQQTHRCHVLSRSYSKFPHRTGLSSRPLLFLPFHSRATEADAQLWRDWHQVSGQESGSVMMFLSSGEQNIVS
jgi:hypothetical protein